MLTSVHATSARMAEVQGVDAGPWERQGVFCGAQFHAARTRFQGWPPTGAAHAYAACQASSAKPSGSCERGCSSEVPQLPSAATYVTGCSQDKRRPA